MKGTGTRLAWLWCLVVVLGLGSHARARVGRGTRPFYRGRTLRLRGGFFGRRRVRRFSALCSRVTLDAISPGIPAIVVENMPGAGSLIAANHLYHVARPDGLTVGQFAGSMLLGQVLGHPGIAVRRPSLRLSRRRRPRARWRARSPGPAESRASTQWAAARVPVKLGAQAPGAASHDTPRILQAALGLPIQLVAGYRGTAEIRLAVEAGEVAGACFNWDSMRAIWGEALDERSGASGAPAGTGRPSRPSRGARRRSTSPGRRRDGA